VTGRFLRRYGSNGILFSSSGPVVDTVSLSRQASILIRSKDNPLYNASGNNCVRLYAIDSTPMMPGGELAAHRSVQSRMLINRCQVIWRLQTRQEVRDCVPGDSVIRHHIAFRAEELPFRFSSSLIGLVGLPVLENPFRASIGSKSGLDFVDSDQTN
jgi:hypothetical protein